MGKTKDRRLKSQPERTSGSISGLLQEEARVGLIPDPRNNFIYSNSMESLKVLKSCLKKS